MILGRRSLVGGALAIGPLALLAGCSSSEGVVGAGSAETAAAAEEETAPLSVYVGSPSCIDPYNCATTADQQVVWQLFDPLTRYDYETGELCGLAAESWDVSDDACTFTFHLRSGMTFHNGAAVTSSSFKRAWERLLNPEGAPARLFGESGLGYLLALVEGYGGLAAGATSELTGVTCPDDETLEVALSRPYADFPMVVAHPALSPVPFIADANAEYFYYAPAGNGPFMLAEDFKWDGAGDLSLVRFEDYYGEAPSVDAVVLCAYSDVDAALDDFEDGALDVTAVPVGDLSSVKKECGLSEDGRTMDEGGRLVLGSELAVSFLVCNTAAAPLDELQVRRALSLAIDRDYLSDSVYLGTHFSADGIVAPDVKGYRAGVWAYAVHDLERAQELLEPLYPADEDGERDLSLALTYYRDGGHDEVVGALVDDLRKAGVTLTENAVSWEALTTRLADGSFELALFSWTPEHPLMDTVLYPLFHSATAGVYNFSGFADEGFDAAIEEARAQVDDEARLALYQEAEDFAAAEMPVIPLVVYGHAMAASERVAHLFCSPQGRLDLAAAELA